MTNDAEDPRPAGTSEPSPPVNNGIPPDLPPSSYGASSGWGASPQPQAPTWPYAPGTYPPGMYPPPNLYAPPAESAAPTMIGPDHVPWKWYDVGLILLIVLVGGAALVGGVTTLALRAFHASDLVTNTVVGVVVYAVALLAMWLIIVKKYRVGWSALGVRPPPGLYWALLVPILCGMYIASAIASAIIVYIFFGGNAPENPQIKDLTGGGGFKWSALILALITASIVAPVVEELFFRGVLYGWLRTRWHIVGGVILSAALFSLAHAIPLIFASIFIVGVTLAIVYEKTKSTLATMALHSLFNTIGVILVFIDLARK